MEIIKRSAQGSAKFIALKSFYWRMGKRVEVGEEIEIENPSDQVSSCQWGKVKPVLPKTAIYVALTTITLPGRKEKFEAKKMELVELKDSDALPLLLNGSVIPRDDSLWRPFGRRLKQGDDKGKAKLEQDALDKARHEDNLYEIGIHPAQKKRK